MTTPACSALDFAAGRPLPTAVILCAVLEDEIRHYAAGMSHIVRIELLEQGLHNEPDRLRRELQAAIDRIERDTPAEAIVLGYGLCSRGTEGATTRRAKLVMARAHDCITLLLGGKERYAAYVKEFPGTYWYSPGWNRCHIPPGKERYDLLYKQYVEKYGEDNAQFLMETEQEWFTKYTQATYVDLGVGVTEKDIQYTRTCAEWLKWSFDHQHGEPQLLVDLLAGRWDDERFIVLEPGETFRMTADERVVELMEKKPQMNTDEHG